MSITFDSYSALKNTTYLQEAAKGTFLSWNRVFLFKNNADGKILVATYNIGQRALAVLKSLLCRISYGEALTGKKVTVLNVANVQAEIQKTDNLGKITLSSKQNTPPATPKKRLYPSKIPTPVASPARLPAVPTQPASTPDQLINIVMTALTSKQQNTWDAVVQHIDKTPSTDQCWEEIHTLLKDKAENYTQAFTNLIQRLLQTSKNSEEHLKRLSVVLAKHGVVVYRLNETKQKQAETEHCVQFLPRELVPESVTPEALAFHRNIQDGGFDLLVKLTEQLAAKPSFFLHHYLEDMYEAIAWKHQDSQSKLCLSETQFNKLLEIKSDVVDVLRLWSAPLNVCSCEDYCKELQKYDKYFVRAHVPLLLQNYSMILQGGTQTERAKMRPIVQEYFCAETILPLLDDAKPDWTCMILNALFWTYRDEEDCVQPIKEIFDHEKLENLLLSNDRISGLCDVSDGNGKKMVSLLWHQCSDVARFSALSKLDLKPLLTESSFVEALKAFCTRDEMIKMSPKICENALVKVLELEKEQEQVDTSFWTKQIERPEFVLLKDRYNQ